MDILAALADQSAPRGSRRCELGLWLDAIPAETPGRDELIRLVETKHARTKTTPDAPETLSGQRVAVVLTRLGFETTQNPVLDHRNHACRCYRS